jgi:hypothetical protein
MTTPTVALPGLVPLSAAPVFPEYPKFNPVAVPPMSGAHRAWQGIIQPFRDDAIAQQILGRIEAGASFQNDAGSLFCQQPSLMTPHPVNKFLVGMDIRFKILVLELPQFEHPVAYMIEPEMSPYFLSFHPHSRGDCPLIVATRRLPALCVYSGAVFQFSSGTDRMVQFLDQVSTYLARHAIWLRTRILLRCTRGDMDEIVFKPSPGFPIVDAEVGKRTFFKLPGDLYWNGYWPGKAAPSGAANHLETIAPNDPCWCWTGKRYEGCHRKMELKMVGKGR